MQKTKKTLKHRKNASERTFRGMPVVDAKSAIKVQPSARDIKIAKRRDPEHCPYAECLRRQYGATNVWIFKSVAYVQMLDEEGSPIIERYLLGAEGKIFVHRFDSGIDVKPAGFNFLPPQPASTLDAITQRKRRISKERAALGLPRHAPKQAYISGSKKTGAPIDPIELTGCLRSGMGMVHFRAKDTQIKKREAA